MISIKIDKDYDQKIIKIHDNIKNIDIELKNEDIETLYYLLQPLVEKKPTKKINKNLLLETVIK